MSSILVLGGTGYIGRNLLARLSRQGWTCYSISRSPPIKRISGVKYFFTDITDAPRLFSILQPLDVEYVANCAGTVNHAQFGSSESNQVWKEHFFSVVNVAGILAEKKIKRYLHVGTCLEYGNVPPPQKENMRELPHNPYGLAKLNVSHYLKAQFERAGLRSTVIRLFQVYGPNQDDNRLIPHAIEKLRSNNQFFCRSGDLIRDFVYIDDVIDLFEAVLINKNGPGQVLINCGSGEGLRIRDLVTMIQKNIKMGEVVFSREKQEFEPAALIADIKKARDVYNWFPKISLSEGINMLLAEKDDGQ